MTPSDADTLDSIKAYRKRAAYLINALEDTEADLSSVLVNTQDLLKRAKQGFNSDRVNMKSDDGGISRLNESMPAIEVSCLGIQIKVNEMLLKILTADEQPDTNITVVVNPVDLEDRL